jgi:vancomycin permeability regulator SanA
MEMDDFKCRMCGACCRIKDGIVRVSDAKIAAVADVVFRRSPKFLGPREALPDVLKEEK